MKNKHLINIFCILLVNVFLSSIQAQETDDYTVQRGDVASKIAENYSMTLEQFKQLNNLDDVNKIKEGQVVKVLRQKKQQSPTEFQKSSEDVSITNGNNDKAKQSYPKKKIADRKKKKKKGDENSDDGKDDNSDPNQIMLVIGLSILTAAILGKVKLWDKIEINGRHRLFFVLITIGLLFVLFSWRFFRALFIWLIILAIVIAFCYFLIKKYGIKKKTSATRSSTDNVEYLKRRIKELEQENKRLKAENSQMIRKNRVLTEEKADLREENNKSGKSIDKQTFISHNSQQDSAISSNANRQLKVEKTNDTSAGLQKLYAEAIMAGELMKVRDKIGDDTIFELELQNKDVASLNILTSVYQRILANSAYVDGCDKQIMGNSTVKVTPGKAICNEQGKWIVTEKPVVIIS